MKGVGSLKVVFLPVAAVLNYFPQQQGGKPNHHPENHGFDG
jgi:hypothetical protein